jgi:predicted transcriptional regulator of viral defense system
MRSNDFFETHPVFTHGEYVSAHTASGRSKHTSNSLLRQHLATGRLLRVRRGVYAVVPRAVDPTTASVDPYQVATKLADDAVVSYHGALQFHGKVYSVSRRFHYVTRRRARPFSFRGSEFVPVLASQALRDLPDLGGGILEQPHSGGVVRVATLERSLVDVFDAPDKVGSWEEIWRSLEMVEFFDLDAVIAYARKLGSAIACARVGFFLEQHREALMVEGTHLAELREMAPGEPRYFDPKRGSGKFVSSWNLVVPEQLLTRAWEEVY